MRVSYSNTSLEKLLIAISGLLCVAVAASFVMLFGFDRPPLVPARVLYWIQYGLLAAFLAEKIIRIINARSAREYLAANWFEIPFLAILATVVFTARYWVPESEIPDLYHAAVGVYLVTQVIVKACRTVVAFAASGRNPAQTLILSFVVLITTGAGLLMLPKASTAEPLSFVDALFTSTSATCVTGLIVKETGHDFTLMGQLIILTLIQLGGLGIVVFGAVIALLLGQALSVRESVAMQDLLSAQTVSRIGKIIAFIFFGTLLIEAIGALAMFDMWDNVTGRMHSQQHQWFCTVFHSISAFCNAGFSLFPDSLVRYNRYQGVYTVMAPLIILGGLGFGVLYDLFSLLTNRIKRFFKRWRRPELRLAMHAPRRMQLQTKVVLAVSAALSIIGMLAIVVFERCAGSGNPGHADWLGAFFQSVTARTAGFNTVEISGLSAPSQFVLILLMIIGGSPGSTAGGIKTATFAVLLMTVIAALRKRAEVEMFSRSVRLAIVGRAITITVLYVAALFAATLLLTVTENDNGFTFGSIAFEAASALGTVGLTTGITPALTAAGKFVIIAAMLVGRLGPLTLVAAMTFNLKPVKYSYPEEPVMVG
jgi:trk system potassium uptake protein TrkH